MIDSMDGSERAVFLDADSLAGKFDELRSHGKTEIESPIKLPEDVTVYLGVGLSRGELQAIELKGMSRVLRPVSETIWSLNLNPIGNSNLVARLTSNLENAVVVFGTPAISGTPSPIPSAMPSVMPSASPSSKPSPAPSALPTALHGSVEIKT